MVNTLFNIIKYSFCIIPTITLSNILNLITLLVRMSLSVTSGCHGRDFGGRKGPQLMINNDGLW